MDGRPKWRDLFPLRRDPKGCVTISAIFGAAAILVIPVALYLGVARLVGSDRQPKGPPVVTHAETDPEKWRALLQEISDLTIADAELREYLPQDNVEQRWLGEPPATNEEIAAAEARLGVALPPSYKAFLKVSNGWHYPNSFIVKLGSTSEIGWSREVDPEMVSGWQAAMEQHNMPHSAPERRLSQTLLINKPDEMDDASYLMLDPRPVHGEEMEAWFFAHWVPGAETHPSFWHLMVDVRDTLRHMRKKG